MALSVRTDRKWKLFVYRQEVPKRVLASQFDYQDEDVVDGFFKYHGVWYHLDQFMRIPNGAPLAGWDGYLNDSMTTGVVIKLSPDQEQYQVGAFAS